MQLFRGEKEKVVRPVTYHLEGLRMPLVVSVPQFGNHCYRVWGTYVFFLFHLNPVQFTISSSTLASLFLNVCSSSRSEVSANTTCSSRCWSSALGGKPTLSSLLAGALEVNVSFWGELLYIRWIPQKWSIVIVVISGVVLKKEVWERRSHTKMKRKTAPKVFE